MSKSAQGHIKVKPNKPKQHKFPKISQVRTKAEAELYNFLNKLSSSSVLFGLNSIYLHPYLQFTPVYIEVDELLRRKEKSYICSLI